MRWERVQGLVDSSSGPGKRWGHTCNTVKGGRFLYVFGGFGKDNCLTNCVHVFDAETKIWTQPIMNGVPPCPRDSHSCTTVGDNLFVFGGTDGTNYLNDLYILDTSSNTWICPEVRGEGPEGREAHSATLVDKRIFIFGGCGKTSGSDDEVFYNDLYILNTETFVWKRAVTTGNPPSARDSHTCSAWKNKIVVVGGEDLDDYYLSDVHVLDTDTFVWKEMNTSGQPLTPRAGHVTVALERNLFVFGGFTNSQNLYDDLYMLDMETGVWSKVVAMEEGPSARFSTSAVSLDPYKAGSFFFVGGCNKNLEPLDDIYYLHTEGGYDARFNIRKQMKLKCHGQKLAVARPNIDQGRENLPLNNGSNLIGEGKIVFHARVTENVPLGYTIDTVIDGKVLRGVLFSNTHSSVPSSSNGRRHGRSEDDLNNITKKPRTMFKDVAGSSSQQEVPINPSDVAGSSSQQEVPINPCDDANKKIVDTNDVDTPMIDTADANKKIVDVDTPMIDTADANKKIVDVDTPMIDTAVANGNMTGTHEAETAAVTSDVKDPEPSQLDTEIVNNAELSTVTLNQANVETSRNEISAEVGATAKPGLGEDSQPQNKEEEAVAAEDATGEQQPQPH